MILLLIYVIVINLFSFLLYGWDKQSSRKEKRRIPEKILILVSLFGGAIGSLLGMFFWHHKTRKWYFWIWQIVGILVLCILGYCLFTYEKNNHYYTAEDFGITIIYSDHDENQNGIDDYTDILLGARMEAESHPRYHSAYYVGGYPPETEGVCTDTIWRAFQNAGYSLKDMVDEDITNHIELYPRVAGKQDKNIDFRRVKNLKVFFDRHSEILTNDITDISEWMPGDIVIFGKDYSHIAIISDRRNKKGIPFLIHNAGQLYREEDALEKWDRNSGVVAHYRFVR